jgi:hypothetical protein
MKMRIAVAAFALLSLCSVASMKLTSETKPAVGDAGGLPTPCIPKPCPLSR